MPAPVVVMKDVGGFVNEYQSQTELYRATDREVRLHECRSACTLALSLPNVCVYPDSALKFHMAYDPRNHQSNYDVSQQLFNSYPPAVRERLGSLTRDYKVLRGAELIALGVRDCNAPRQSEAMVASNAARRAAAAPALADFERATAGVSLRRPDAQCGVCLRGAGRQERAAAPAYRAGYRDRADGAGQAAGPRRSHD